MKSGPSSVKENVQRFNDDVRRTGSYAYTAGRKSSRLANARISEGIRNIFEYKDRRILDLGCGDGTYSLDFVEFGAREVLGIDPAESAVEAARGRAANAGLTEKVRFEVGNIYDADIASKEGRFDCVVFRGVLHHLQDPPKALACAASLTDAMIVLEPNGYNPVLKILESFSAYHLQHEEQSFFPVKLIEWINATGLRVQMVRYLNLVPMFCPDWLATMCKAVEAGVERTPVLSKVACGQCLILATRV